jgi:acid phosphatase family membrane protein YuiD
MSMERSTAAMPAEPVPPPAVPGGTTAAEEVTPALRLQILATEHWSLLATRSLAWSEVFSRAGMYLSALSGAIVALALVGQGSGFGEPFLLFALVLLPVVFFIGETTLLRLGAANTIDATCVVGMNRIRGAYLAMAPDLAPFFVTSAHDDARGMGVTMGMPDRGIPLSHVLSATPGLISTVNGVVGAAITVALGVALGFERPVIVVLGIAAFLVVMVGNALLGLRSIAAEQGRLRPLFPSPERGG